MTNISKMQQLTPKQSRWILRWIVLLNELRSSQRNTMQCIQTVSHPPHHKWRTLTRQTPTPIAATTDAPMRMLVCKHTYQRSIRHALSHNTHTLSHTDSVYIPKRAYQALRASVPLALRLCRGLLRWLMMSSEREGPYQKDWAVMTECTYIVYLVCMYVLHCLYNDHTHTCTLTCQSR